MTNNTPHPQSYYVDALAHVLISGREAAEAADADYRAKGLDKGCERGTCNFDDVFLAVNGRVFKDPEPAIRAASLPVRASTWRLMGKNRRGYFVAHTLGQADRRTLMMEAFLRAAKAATPDGMPWEFLGYYQMD